MYIIERTAGKQLCCTAYYRYMPHKTLHHSSTLLSTLAISRFTSCLLAFIRNINVKTRTDFPNRLCHFSRFFCSFCLPRRMCRTLLSPHSVHTCIFNGTMAFGPGYLSFPSKLHVYSASSVSQSLLWIWSVSFTCTCELVSIWHQMLRVHVWLGLLRVDSTSLLVLCTKDILWCQSTSITFVQNWLYRFSFGGLYEYHFWFLALLSVGHVLTPRCNTTVCTTWLLFPFLSIVCFDITYLCFPSFTWIWIGALISVVQKQSTSIFHLPLFWFRLNASLLNNCLHQFVGPAFSLRHWPRKLCVT